MDRVIVTFQSARAVIKAEKLCVDNGLKVAVIPSPREFSKDCGMALRVEVAVVEQFENLMRSGDIKFTIHAS